MSESTLINDSSQVVNWSCPCIPPRFSNVFFRTCNRNFINHRIFNALVSKNIVSRDIFSNLSTGCVFILFLFVFFSPLDVRTRVLYDRQRARRRIRLPRRRMGRRLNFTRIHTNFIQLYRKYSPVTLSSHYNNNNNIARRCEIRRDFAVREKFRPRIIERPVVYRRTPHDDVASYTRYVIFYQPLPPIHFTFSAPVQKFNPGSS